MPEQRNLFLTRMARVYRRMVQALAGGAHEPAIRATRGEAPKISRAYTLETRKIDGVLTALSTSERNAIVLALYHPGTFELLTQSALSPISSPHPLHDSPLPTDARQVRPFKGTLDVAARFGVLRHHPTQRVRDDTAGDYAAAVPLVGDLLLFLLDARGPYCVNWNIKKYIGDHGKPGPGPVRKRHSPRTIERAAARLDIEVGYYDDAGIRTQLVAGEQMENNAIRSLLHLFRWNLRPVSMRPAERKMLENQFRLGMRDGVPPIDTINLARTLHGCSNEDCRRVLNQAIWRRELRVDLFRPVLVDRPLRPEQRDVLVEYADWFRR